MSEETEEIKTIPLYPYLLQREQALPNCKPISVGLPGDARYTTPLLHPSFVCVEVLRPSQPNRVMSSAVSLPNHMFTGQA